MSNSARNKERSMMANEPGALSSDEYRAFLESPDEVPDVQLQIEGDRDANEVLSSRRGVWGSGLKLVAILLLMLSAVAAGNAAPFFWYWDEVATMDRDARLELLADPDLHQERKRIVLDTLHDEVIESVGAFEVMALDERHASSSAVIKLAREGERIIEALRNVRDSGGLDSALSSEMLQFLAEQL